MTKHFIIFLAIFILTSQQIKSFALVTRLYDFNNTSDLTTYFNSDGTPSFSGSTHGGLKLTSGINTPLGPEDIWTSKKGYFTNLSGDSFKISGYYYNLDNYGFGSLGFTDNDTNTGDGMGSPTTGLGVVFHGGGGYFVNNGDYTEVLWPPDLEDEQWYYFEFIASRDVGNDFNLILRIYKADQLGTLLVFKTMENLTVTNPTIANASKLYSYFGTADARYTTIDDIEIELSGATFEEDGKPQVTTTTVSGITTNSAISGGEVTSELGNSVTARGVCYATTPNPIISGTCTSNGSGLGSFTSNLNSLNPNTTYYYRSYATNSNGTSYGSEKNFKTSSNSKTFKLSKNVCLKSKPPKINWITIKPSEKKGKKGMMLNWSQNDSDWVTILIDNGTGKYPYRVTKTKNDGGEFLENVTSNQKIKIQSFNGCRTGDISIGVSRNSHPFGFFNKK